MVRFAQGVIVGLGLLLLSATGVLAQGNSVAAAPNLPPTFQLQGLTHIWQGWNNCGPATVTEALSFFGGTHDQYIAAKWLKPKSGKMVPARQPPWAAGAICAPGKSGGYLRPPPATSPPGWAFRPSEQVLLRIPRAHGRIRTVRI